MDQSLGELNQSLRDEARRFAQRQVAPVAGQIDHERQIPQAILDATHELGFYGLIASDEDGGVGLDGLAFVLVVEALAFASPSLARRVASHGGPAVVALGEAGLLNEDISMGRPYCAFADPDSLIGPAPAKYLVVGRNIYDSWSTEPAFMLGHHGADLVKLAVQKKPVAEVSEAAGAFDDLGLAAVALGSGRAALAAALGYAVERQQFRRPIAEFQAIQWKLADSETALCAAEVMLHRAALQPTVSNCAAARLATSRAACLAADHAIQIHGGSGYTREYAAERLFRSAKMCALGADRMRAAVYQAAPGV